MGGYLGGYLGGGGGGGGGSGGGGGGGAGGLVLTQGEGMGRDGYDAWILLH